jgi:signal transduction histidine kinase
VIIRTRLTLWYAGVLLATLGLLGGGLYYELVIERRQARAEGHRQVPVREEINEVLGFYALPALLITVLGGWWLTRKALAPVAALTEAVATTHAQNLRARLPRSGNGDELDRLTEVFNGMLGRLEDSFAREREFTLHASHELKTPLTVMRGQVETALRDEALTPAQRELFTSQLEEIQRLAGIVEGLSFLAKADAGQLKLGQEPVRLDELVEDSFADAQILARPTDLRLTLESCEPATVTGDRHRLRQLLLILTDNAIRYNISGGSFRLGLRRQPRAAELILTNTGYGLSEDQIPRVFDRFFRGDPAHNPNVEGSGLGLSIAQWIVTAHGGTIHFLSNLNQLTTVTVRLPLAEGR